MNVNDVTQEISTLFGVGENSTTAKKSKMTLEEAQERLEQERKDATPSKVQPL